MVLDIPEGERSGTVRKAQQIIRQVLPQEEHQYIPSREENQDTSLGEMFDILQNSLQQGFQSKFQAAASALDLVQNRQIASESLMRAVHNNLSHSVMGVRDDLVKYIEHLKHTDDLAQGVEPMEVDSIGPIPNNLADTLANIASCTLAVEQAPSASSAFTKFPRHLSATQEKSSQRKPRERATPMS